MSEILVTADLVARHGDALKAVLAAAPHWTLRVLDCAAGDLHRDLPEVQAAFLSTDLMSIGSNPAINPPLAGFLDRLDRAPALRWVQLCSAGADRPAFQALMRRGVVVTTASGANAQAVAHTALAALLALARGVPLWVRETDARRWTPRRAGALPGDLQGTRATVVGLGPIGSEIARLCQAFGLHVTGVRRSAAPAPHCDAVVPTAQLGALLPHTDWLILACPLTPQTRGLIDAAMLARLPPQAHLINVARGAIVAEAALAAALHGGQLAGAYADVFETEPLPPDSPLWAAPNFLLSAHSAGMSAGFAGRTVDIFIANLQRWLRGEALLHRAQPASP